MELFKKLLYSIYESEALIDIMRKGIANSQITVDEFFRDINSERNGRITISELEGCLLRYDESISAMQVAVLFYRICTNKSAYLIFNQFELFCYGSDVGRSLILRKTNQVEKDNNESIIYFSEKRRRSDHSKIIEKLCQNSKLEGEIEEIQKYLISKRDLKLHNLFNTFRPVNNLIDIHSFIETLKNIFLIPLVDISDVALLFRKLKRTSTKE